MRSASLGAAFAHIVEILFDEAVATGHRRALIVAGPPGHSRPLITHALPDLADDLLWIGSAPEGVERTVADARRALGQQARVVVLDLTDRTQPDAVGAAGGIAAGGGLLIMLVPPLARWGERTPTDREALHIEPHPASAIGERFTRRFARIWRTAPGVTVFDAATGQVHRGPPAPDAPTPAPAVSDPWCLTEDQRRAVDAVLKVARGRRRRPAVLTADRGRGKSAALGIAAGLLAADDRGPIVVIGPSRSAVAPVFAHASRVADGRVDLRFVAPAELASGLPEASLILVDEAATLPLAILRRVVEGHPRVVFATTVHGYEGTGRGFAVRFTALLDRVRPNWRAIRLDAPIRWAPGDPVERAVFDALMLDASPVEHAADDGPVVFDRWDRDRLAADETTLATLFGLLVNAHYRTSPADLERLLDSPDLAVWTGRTSSGAVVAAALVAAEGGLDPALASAIHSGARRPNGHLLPETLAAHLGLADAPIHRMWRVVRIAVHPATRRRGVGSGLLASIEARARAEGVDALGSAFGATPDLLAFWTRSGHRPVRLGLTRGRSSGLHSAVVLRPLSTAGEALFTAARQRFAKHLIHALGEPLRALDPALAVQIMRGLPIPLPDLDRTERHELHLFSAGHRVYGVVIDLIWRLAVWAVALGAGLSDDDRRLLVMRVLQRRPWAMCAEALGARGRPDVIRRLAAVVSAAMASTAAENASEE